MINKKELMAYVPLISYILYSTAGPVIPLQGLVAYSFLGICCLFSAYSIIRIKRTRFSNWIFVFLSMQLLYFIFTDKVLTAADGDPVYTWGFMKGIVWTFVPYFFAYYLASKGRLERKHIIFCTRITRFKIFFTYEFC